MIRPAAPSSTPAALQTELLRAAILEGQLRGAVRQTLQTVPAPIARLSVENPQAGALALISLRTVPSRRVTVIVNRA